MAKLAIWLRLPLFVFGVSLLFIADRYMGAETYHMGLRIAALVLVALSVALAFGGSLAAGSAGFPGEAKGWRLLGLWQLGGLVSLGLYLLYAKLVGDAGGPQTLGHKAVLAGWLVLGSLSLFSGIGLELAMRESGRGSNAEPRRVARAGSGWLTVGMLFGFLVAINYTADRKDVTRDWSYLKVRTPSESTTKMLSTLTKPMTIALFYPQGNDVRGLLSEYFAKVGAIEPRIKIEYYDKDMAPTKAEEYRVSRNGQIVFDIDGKRSRIDTGTVLAKARKSLKELDQEFQKSFLEITSEKKTLYFTRGHGEASWVGDSGEDPLRSLRLLETFLRQQNYTTRLFGMAEGSATAVPDDAAAVVIVGPMDPFQKEEVDVLRTYVQNGGNLLVFLDVERGGADPASLSSGAEQPLHGLLAEMGIKYNAEPLANDKNFVAATRSESDKWFIFSNIFTSHDSVVSLARHDERVAILMFQAGWLQVTPELGNWKAFETVRTLSDTFADKNRDFKFAEPEKRDAYVVGAVAEYKLVAPKAAGTPAAKVKNGRVAVLTDATAVADGIVRNVGNALFFADTLKWLVGETELQGALASEQDVKIRHTRKEDVVWFYGTVIAVPLLVLGGGWLATRRSKNRGKGSDKSKQKGGAHAS